MKIVYVYPHFVDLAGTERVMIDKMNYLADHYGYEVYMLTNEQGNHPISFPLAHGVKHIDLDVRFTHLYKRNQFVRILKWGQYNRILRKKYNELMKELNPDIVVASTYHSNYISIIGDCPLPYVRILESHINKRFILTNDPLNQKRILRWLHTFFQMKQIDRKARCFDLLVALEKGDADDWNKYVKTIIVPNVVHLNSTGKYCDKNSKQVIFVGRYTEQKGIFDLFDVWKLVYKKHPDWHLNLYGDGHLRERIMSEAEHLSMNIHVHKPDSQIFDRYMENTVLLLSSVYEPFGLVMPEAMSCGLPVVAFDCPYGPANIITDGLDGFLIPNRDKRLFAEKVCSLIESPDLRERMGKAAIQSSQRYSCEIVMPIWKDLLERLVNTRK